MQHDEKPEWLEEECAECCGNGTKGVGPSKRECRNCGGHGTVLIPPQAQSALAAKDAEIARLKMELDGELAGRRDVSKLLEGDDDEPRWKWIRIAIGDLKDSLAHEATRAARLESANAALRELLGECMDTLMGNKSIKSPLVQRVETALKEAGVRDGE